MVDLRLNDARRRRRRWRGWGLALGLALLAGTAPDAALPAGAAVSISGAYFSPKSSRRPLRKSTRFIILHTTEGPARGSLEKLRANV